MPNVLEKASYANETTDDSNEQLFPYDVIYSVEANLDFSSPVNDMRKVYFVTDD